MDSAETAGAAGIDGTGGKDSSEGGVVMKTNPLTTVSL
jgi:hypothetical protein